MKKLNFYSLDIETLGTNNNAPIIQVGACLVEEGSISEKFELNVQWDSLAGDDYVPSISTLAWWNKQSEIARKSVFNQEDSVPIFEAVDKLINFMEKDYFIFCHLSFDYPIIKHATIIEGIVGLPPYWKWCDLRTLDAIYGKYEKERKGEHHTALADAIYQAESVINRVKI